MKKHSADKVLTESESRFRNLFTGMMNGFAHHEIICDSSGTPVDYRFMEINPAFTSITGLQREDVIGRTFREVMPGAEQAWIEQYGKIALDGGEAHFEQYNEGLNQHFEVHAYSTEHGWFATIFRDVSEKVCHQRRLLMDQRRLATIISMGRTEEQTNRSLFDKALNFVVDVTESLYGYIYLYNEENRQFTLHAWSEGVMADCAVNDSPKVYSLDKTGIWGEAVRQRRPIRENDFAASNPFKRGYPEGHVELARFLTVPVFEGESIVAVVGVANKKLPYDDDDESILHLFMQDLWQINCRRVAEMEKGQLQERLKIIFDSSNSGITLLDHDFRVVFANNQMSTMFCYGFSVEEPVSYFDLVHPDERERVIRCHKESVAGLRNTIYSERRFLRGNGEEFLGLVNGRCSFDDTGRFEHLVLVITDISPLKKMEDERRHLQNQLVHSQKLELVGQLAGGVAHDFNNILTGIIGYANLSLHSASSGLREEYLHNIVELSDRAGHLTQSLLTFSRKQPTKPRNSDLNLIVSRTQKIMGRLIGDNVSLEIHTVPGSLDVFVDQQQIAQAIMNLITNAVQAMDKSGLITVRTMLRSITAEEARVLAGAREGEFAVIEVADNGAGISPEHLLRIFEPFFTTKEVGKGTGLGLSVVFGVIERHEGFILVDSTPGQGSTFSIFLPLLQGHEKENLQQSDMVPVRGSETILVADDSQEVRHIVTYILQEFGYTVLAAGNGVEAVEIFRQNRGRVDLLLFDIVMPEMDGVEAYKEIAGDAPDIRCLLMTGYTSQEQMAEAENLSIPLLLKPLSPKQILHMVREVLDYGT